MIAARKIPAQVHTQTHRTRSRKIVVDPHPTATQRVTRLPARIGRGMNKIKLSVDPNLRLPHRTHTNQKPKNPQQP